MDMINMKFGMMVTIWGRSGNQEHQQYPYFILKFKIYIWSNYDQMLSFDKARSHVIYSIFPCTWNILQIKTKKIRKSACGTPLTFWD